MDAHPQPFVRPTPPEGHLCPTEVGRRLGTTRQEVCKWCRNTPGLALRIDGRWWIIPTRLNAFLRARAEKAGHAPG
jgi:hypothetical protein